MKTGQAKAERHDDVIEQERPELLSSAVQLLQEKDPFAPSTMLDELGLRPTLIERLPEQIPMRTADGVVKLKSQGLQHTSTLLCYRSSARLAERSWQTVPDIRMEHSEDTDGATASLRPPRGEEGRAAVDPLRGYAFQIYGSVLAWTRLEEDEVLYLEVAEDFAVTDAETLLATQAKDTRGSGSVTLNTPGVRQAIGTLITLADLNPDRTVYLRYMSTSPIGLEASLDDRVEGEAGLSYWGRVATGRAEPGPLLRRLRGMSLPHAAGRFIASCDEDELRHMLVNRIRWDCGRAGHDEIRIEIEEGLTRPTGIHGQRVETADVDRVVGLLVEQVLLTSTKPENRKLSAMGLRRTISQATNVSIPRGQFDDLIAAAMRSHAPASRVSFVLSGPPNWLTRVDDIPLPRRVVPRSGTVRKVLGALKTHGIVALSGGTGMGKSLLARLAADAVGGIWHSVDLQTGSASEVADRVRATLGNLDEPDGHGVILEDLDAWEDAGARRALSSLLGAMLRQGRPCLATTHRDPSRGALEALGVRREAVIQVPKLDKDETHDLAALAGARTDVWGGLVWIASDGGHPQLAQAVVTDLEARDWSPEALAEYLGADIPQEIRRERADARRRLLEAVRSEDVRLFLYRASLILGRFDRPLALALGAVTPPTPRPGEALDQLVGPWIDEVGPEQYRVSPLVGDAGEATLTNDEKARVHVAVAAAIMGHGSIDVAYADALLFHAMRGKVETALFVIGSSFFGANEDDKRMLAEWSSVLRFLPTSRPPFPETPFLSLTLRLAQFEALAIKGTDDELAACARALLGELDMAGDVKEGRLLEAGTLAQLLTQRRLGIAIGLEWIDPLVRLGELVGDEPLFAGSNLGSDAQGPGTTLLGMAFSAQCSTAADVAALEAIFDRIEELTPPRRAVLLRAANEAWGGLALVVQRPMVEEEDRGTIKWRDASARYLRMAGRALAWGARDLAIRCLAARAMVTDESGGASDEALRVLDDADALVGADPILARARAKVLWRKGDHAAALPYWSRCVDALEGEGAVERAFMAREGAISAAFVGEYATARDWFDKGRRCSNTVQSMVAMTVGLTAEVAICEVRLGLGRDALLTFTECLERLADLDPLRDLKTAYVHKLVGAAVLWAYGELTGQVLNLADGPARMLPGACSAPDPSSDYRGDAHASLDRAWYTLALADVEGDLNAGVDTSLDDRLEGRAIPNLEMNVRHGRLERAIRVSDAAAFALALPPWMDVHAHIETPASDSEAVDGNQVGVPFPRTGPKDWARPKPRKALRAALTAFALTAATNGRFGELEDLGVRLGAIVERDEGIYDYLARMAGQLGPRETALRDLGDVVALLRRDNPRSPCDSMIVSIRLLEAADEVVGIHLGKVVGPPLSRWMEAEWSRVADRQAFAITNPRRSVPAIVEAVSGSKADLPSAARIANAALQAVPVPLDEPLRTMLSTMAARSPSAP